MPPTATPRTPRPPRGGAPPPVPLRRTQSDYTPMYRTPAMYNTGMYGSMYGGNYGNYGGAYNRHPINNFVRLAEDSSRPAFESMENIVQAFGSIAMVLESTSFAVQSSFRAVLGLAEHFSRLRVQMTQMISTFTLFRTLRYLYRKLMVFLRLRSQDTSVNDDVWTELANSEGLFGKGNRKSSWPLILFFCIVIGGPYIIWRLMASMKEDIGAESWMTGEGEHFVAVADYDYDAENDDEVSFNAAQEIRVAPKDLQPRIRGWLLASVDGEKSGLIPANYVRIRGRRPAAARRTNAVTSQANAQQVWTDVTGRAEDTGRAASVDGRHRNAETETSSANEESEPDPSPLPSVDSAIGSDHKETEGS